MDSFPLTCGSNFNTRLVQRMSEGNGFMEIMLPVGGR